MSPLVPVSRLAGRRVCSPAGETLGTIENLMVDPDHGNVAYVVMSLAGGSPPRQVAAPMKALRFEPGRDALVLDITADRLQDAPRFDPAQGPATTDARWALEVHRHYGVSPYWE